MASLTSSVRVASKCGFLACGGGFYLVAAMLVGLSIFVLALVGLIEVKAKSDSEDRDG